MSKRTFQVAECYGAGMDCWKITLQEILDPTDDREVVYALQEIIDDILDLPAGDSMYFQPNRDDDGTKGIIRRMF